MFELHMHTQLFHMIRYRVKLVLLQPSHQELGSEDGGGGGGLEMKLSKGVGWGMWWVQELEKSGK